MKNKNNFWPRRKIILKEIILREEQSLIKFDWLRRFFSTRMFFLFKKKNILYIIPIDRKGKKNEKK